MKLSNDDTFYLLGTVPISPCSITFAGSRSMNMTNKNDIVLLVQRIIRGMLKKLQEFINIAGCIVWSKSFGVVSTQLSLTYLSGKLQLYTLLLESLL